MRARRHSDTGEEDQDTDKDSEEVKRRFIRIVDNGVREMLVQLKAHNSSLADLEDSEAKDSTVGKRSDIPTTPITSCLVSCLGLCLVLYLSNKHHP